MAATHGRRSYANTIADHQVDLSMSFNERALLPLSALQIVAVILSLVVFWIAIWIVLPAPTYVLLAFSVGAPEVSQWLIAGALSAIALLARAAVSSRLAQLAVAMAVVALGLALTVWIRIPAAVRRFDAQMQGLSLAPATP